MAQRIAVAGVSGSGKSTLARRLAALLALPYVEIDSLQHGPDWSPRPSFLADVQSIVAGDRWVIEYQYAEAKPSIAARADLLVWLDLPTHVVMWQVVRRTLRRRLRHEELWNGNLEPPLRTILSDPDHIVRWAWKTRHKLQGLDETIRRSHPEVEVVRLSSRRAVDRWVAGLVSAGRT